MKNGAIKFTDRQKNTRTYFAHSMDFHSPSEHTIEGSHLDLELQFHMYDPEDPSRIAHTFAVFFDRGPNKEKGSKANPFLKQLAPFFEENNAIEFQPTRADKLAVGSFVNKVLAQAVDESGEGREFWTYEGSLSKPPCYGDV